MRCIAQALKAISGGGKASAVGKRVLLSRNYIWLIQIGLAVVYLFLLARELSATAEAYFREATATYKLLLVATIYIPPLLCGRFAVEFENISLCSSARCSLYNTSEVDLLVYLLITLCRTTIFF